MHGDLIVVDDVPAEFAARVIDAFHTRPDETFSLALSGGETAGRCYERLADVGAEPIDWWQVDIYWGDERCVPQDDPASNYLLGRARLLERVGAANSVHPMLCAEGPEAYQLLLGELVRLDVVHLGLGQDGHTASLFPSSPALRADPGRLVTMNSDPLGNNPYDRMTLTYSGIARARLALVTVSGEEKRAALQAVRDGMDVPAAHVKADAVVWIADRAAAG